MSNYKDYYSLLGVSPDADSETIAEAYDRLAQELQPDVDAEPSDPVRMRDLDEAFDVLDDPERRAEYDRSRAAGDDESPPPVWAAGGAGAGAGTGDLEAAGETAALTGDPATSDAGAAPAANPAAVALPASKPVDGRLIGGIALLVAGAAVVAAAIVVLVLALTDDNGGTTVTSSGLQYADTKVGSGASPETGQIATIHFTGKLQDGSTFLATTGQGPFAFIAGKAPIKGLDEGVLTMAVGGQRTVVMPPNLAFGDKGAQGVPGGATVTFDIELIAVSDAPRDNPPEVSSDKKELESGLVAMDTVSGSGDEATTGDTVYVHYTSWLESSGKLFDSSLTRPRVFKFTIGQGGVIRGWDAGVPGMKVGGKRRLLVPAPLGYGDQAQPSGCSGADCTIPANSDLIFDIELLDVKQAPPATPTPAAASPSP